KFLNCISVVVQVYRGTLPNGELFAIKKALQGSIQRAHEFKTEIELLSRVHHKDVIGLVGFCFDQAEQMVYEYILNGTLKDGLSSKTGIRLDWTRRPNYPPRRINGGDGMKGVEEIG
ncbi:hypothetical protein FXO38_28888, partial [Capsicum annuum]